MSISGEFAYGDPKIKLLEDRILDNQTDKQSISIKKTIGPFGNNF